MIDSLKREAGKSFTSQEKKYLHDVFSAVIADRNIDRMSLNGQRLAEFIYSTFERKSVTGAELLDLARSFPIRSDEKAEISDKVQLALKASGITVDVYGSMNVDYSALKAVTVLDKENEALIEEPSPTARLSLRSPNRWSPKF